MTDYLYNTKKEKESDNTFKVGLVIIGLILLAAIVTNPGRDTIKAEFQNHIYNDIVSPADNDYGKFGQELGMKILMENYLIIDNYYAFSIIRFRKKDGTKIIGYGAFTKVWFDNY